jgi:hypothetical protein
MPGANGLPDPSHVAIAAGLGEQTPYLKAILAELRGDVLEVGVSDAYGRELVLDQFPVSGRKRVLAYRTGNGFDALAVPTTGVLALAANEARLGLAIINSGANAVILYLADRQRAGVPAVWLAASGGSWDGRFGNLMWSGNVFAVAQTAATTLTGGEL